MRRVGVLVEGKTEAGFVREVLLAHFIEWQILVEPVVVQSKRVKGGMKYSGGALTYDRVKHELSHLLYSFDFVTTMFDLYALSPTFPGTDTQARGVEKALNIERQMLESINNPKFIPYIQVHEFEALLFCEPSAFAPVFNEEVARQVQAIAERFLSPEEINETPQGAPSKRLLALVGDSYRKPHDGVTIASNIPLTIMREKCPHFAEWLTKLEHLSPIPNSPRG